MNMNGWKHINTAPKDREILVWDGASRYIAEWSEYQGYWRVAGVLQCNPTHWKGCPQPPEEVDAE